MARNVIELKCACSISTMVNNLTHNPKAEGSKPTVGTVKEETA